MILLNRLFFLLFLLNISLCWSQNASLQGVVLNEDNEPLPFVSVTYGDAQGTSTNQNGFYKINIPANIQIAVTFNSLGFKPTQIKVNLSAGATKEVNIVLKTDIEQISEVVITDEKRTRVEGITTISPEKIRLMPGANPGVENMLKTLPGVSSNNELSTQYSVRGGNFDENLVYVDEIQVYRPFLVRSGQQEGLSFINPDLVRNVEFSAGGFQAKYGDKLSSVLAVDYRRPVSFRASAEGSFLGGQVAVEGASKDEKFSGILGVRYRDNSLFVDARQTDANFRPRFTDVQTKLSYQFTEKFSLDFLGNIAINTYDYEPVTRQTNFGTVQDPKALLVFYEGEEQDQFETYFGALKANYNVSDNYTAKFIASAYHTQEQEHFDILAEYRLGAVNSNFGDENFGEVEFTQGAGAQFTHARNDLDGLFINIKHIGEIKKGKHNVEYGLKYAREDIRDRLQEYEMVDSAGFAVRPPNGGFVNDQPYNPFEGEIAPFFSVRAFNETQVDRFSGYAQWSYRTNLGDNKLWLNAGLRGQVWHVNSEADDRSSTQTIISPRAQVSLKPDWEKDILFRLSGGLYQQPPRYRALRDTTGTVIPDVKAQKAYHIVGAMDYSLKLWGRPFKFTAETYYKDLTDVNPYTVENVRIRYRARNDAEAYAYGLDLRLNGEFVPGTQSWFSIGLMKTEEKLDERGYIPRPTDQRLNVGVAFQDYVPNIPKLKLNLNLVYNTGVLGGTPRFADPFEFRNRLPDYTRVDAGFSYVLKETGEVLPKGNLFYSFEYLDIGFEIFNLFDRLNTITNTFVRDAQTKNLFSIPNFLSPRVFNLRFRARF